MRPKRRSSEPAVIPARVLKGTLRVNLPPGGLALTPAPEAPRRTLITPALFSRPPPRPPGEEGGHRCRLDVSERSPHPSPSSPQPSSPIALPPPGRRGSKAGTPQESPL